MSAPTRATARPYLNARPCPNRCGNTLGPGKYACPHCWRILPARLKTPILAAWRAKDFTAHTAAQAAAQAWYDAHTAPADLGGAR